MKRNMVKRNVSLALGAVLVFGAVPAYAADAVTVKLNGSQMEFDVNPVIENSRTLVPFRKIFEALDCAVSYTKENGAQVVTANRGNQWITLEIGKNEITVEAGCCAENRKRQNSCAAESHFRRSGLHG